MTVAATAPPPQAAGPKLYRLPDGRWYRIEIVFWLLPAAAFFLLPGYLVLGSQITGQQQERGRRQQPGEDRKSVV